VCHRGHVGALRFLLWFLGGSYLRKRLVGTVRRDFGMLGRRQVDAAQGTCKTWLRDRRGTRASNSGRRVGARWNRAPVGGRTGVRAAVATAVGWVFFDRGLIDAAAAYQHVTHQPMLKELCWTHRYHRRVFLTPPWPQIYVTDHERQHGFSDAVAEYDRLREIYPSLGYDIHLVPKVSVEKRADFVIAVLDQS
jgi:hypothetical protein